MSILDDNPNSIPTRSDLDNFIMFIPNMCSMEVLSDNSDSYHVIEFIERCART